MASLLIRLPLLLVLIRANEEPKAKAVWDKTVNDHLQTVWNRCHFPPNATKTDDILKLCTEPLSSSKSDEEAGRGISYLCELYYKFVTLKCGTSTKKEITKSVETITGFLNPSLDLCNQDIGIRIPKSVGEVMNGDTCKLTCSGFEAEKLCNVIAIFSLAEYPTLEEAADTIRGTTTTSTTIITTTTTTTPPPQPLLLSYVTKVISTTNETTQPTTSPFTNDDKIIQQGRSTSEEQSSIQETKPQENDTTTSETKIDAPTNNQHPSSNQDNQQLTIIIVYGHFGILGFLSLLIIMVFFAVYKCEQLVLCCLHGCDRRSPSVNDGKGSYRKVPHFETVIPSMDDFGPKSFKY